MSESPNDRRSHAPELSLAWLALLVLLPGCIGTETGNPSVAAVRARTSDPAIATVGRADGVLGVEEAWLSVLDARRLEGAACDHTASQTVLEEVVVELVEGRVIEGFPAPGVCGLHLTFGGSPAPPPGSPAALADHAIVVSGQRADATPFEIEAGFAHGVDLRATDERLGADHSALILSVDLAHWFGGLALDAVPTDADGVARLGTDDPLTLELEGNIPGSLALYVDADENGRLDASELAAGPIATVSR